MDWPHEPKPHEEVQSPTAGEEQPQAPVQVQCRLSVRDMDKKEKAQQRAMEVIKELELPFYEERQRERVWEERSST